jgi:hypothetical protein
MQVYDFILHIKQIYVDIFFTMPVQLTAAFLICSEGVRRFGQYGIPQLAEVGLYYLSEWHFHPDALPNPSRQDERQMRIMAESKVYQCPGTRLSHYRRKAAGF